MATPISRLYHTAAVTPRLDRAKRDRRRRLENEKVDGKICRRAKNRESRRRQRQSGATENRAAGPRARRCDVGLTLRHRRRRILVIPAKAFARDYGITGVRCLFVCYHDN